MKNHVFKVGIIAVSLISLLGCSQGTDSATNTANSQGTIVTHEPQVKKSTSGICHERGSTYYDKTKNFQPYLSLDDCLNSGGRLPKK
ncbi:MAG: hypothetical protein NTZ25_00210 [Candidatus Peregrinibacteria bacterium]|nr:hypothetical protein [Candidatus Peregrinibacteria bacterium]